MPNMCSEESRQGKDSWTIQGVAAPGTWSLEFAEVWAHDKAWECDDGTLKTYVD